MRGKPPESRAVVTFDVVNDKTLPEYIGGQKERLELGEIEERLACNAMLLYATNETPYAGAVELPVVAIRGANSEEGWLNLSIEGDDTSLAIAGLMRNGFIHQSPGNEAMVKKREGLGIESIHQIIEIYLRPDETAKVKAGEAVREATSRLSVPLAPISELVGSSVGPGPYLA